MNNTKQSWGWSYGAILQDSGDFAVHEIYGEGYPDSWTKDPITFSGDDKNALIKALELALADLKGGSFWKIKGTKLVSIPTKEIPQSEHVKKRP